MRIQNCKINAGGGDNSKAITTRPTSTQSLIKWSSHRSTSRKAKLDAITPARVKICLVRANLVRRPSHLAGSSSIGEGFILPITPHPLDRLPAQLHGTRGPRSGTKGQQCTNKQPQQHRRYRRCQHVLKEVEIQKSEIGPEIDLDSLVPGYL